MHFFPFNNPNQSLFHPLRHPLLPDKLALHLTLFSPAAQPSEASLSTPPIHPTETYVCLRRQHTSSSTFALVARSLLSPITLPHAHNAPSAAVLGHWQYDSGWKPSPAAHSWYAVPENHCNPAYRANVEQSA